ncbi:hypothetical protein FEA29_09340 [Mannheimia haemolytica]|nr:hypothetical protein FEA39_02245 [Mannheimia haemolytica]TRC11592.1 hypothetical protein FEA50_12375 [Mannheimia haemolytica]TRC13204.1 hypothetical protein FEA43_02415 [Mannheimia haemolytica]TRC15307.1 hypothetical protein FEA23_10710 [Mannheimia haemolytica]TRC19810.1 hypothetical protein FEA24_10580 [Mannheimia haemolytica]
MRLNVGFSNGSVGASEASIETEKYVVQTYFSERGQIAFKIFPLSLIFLLNEEKSIPLPQGARVSL